MVLTVKKEIEMWVLKKEVDMTWQVSGEQEEERGQTGLPGLCLGNLVNGSTNWDMEYRLKIGLEEFFFWVCSVERSSNSLKMGMEVMLVSNKVGLTCRWK